MPNLKQILFFPSRKDFVDVTSLASRKKRKNPLAFRRKKATETLLKSPQRVLKKPTVLKIIPSKKFKILKTGEKTPARTRKGIAKALAPKKKLVSKISKIEVKKPLAVRGKSRFSQKPKSVQKPTSKQTLKPAPKPAPKPALEVLASVTHFFDKIQVAILMVKKPFKVGDEIRFYGPKTDFSQRIDSMQINHEAVLSVKKGDEIGLKVKMPVRVGDAVCFFKKL